MENTPHILWFKDISKDDVPLVGGKGANLGEMTSAGFPVPNGFCITAPTYFQVIDYNQLRPKIAQLIESLDVNDSQELDRVAKSIQHLIARVDIPKDLSDNIIHAYHQLSGPTDTLVAVRSSATAEDLPDASFAGQQATFLNIKGEANLIEHVKLAWASLFTARAIFYRQQKHYDHFKVALSVPVQKMIQAQASGVMFTLDPVTSDKTVIVIEAVWGLGETIVQGSVTPDHYLIDKKSLAIIQKTVSPQDTMLARRDGDNKNVKVSSRLKKQPKLTNHQIVALAQIGAKLHHHYFFPQDIEWALENHRLYIVQTRPVTTIGKKLKTKDQRLKTKTSNLGLEVILKGDPASPGIGSGHVRIVRAAKEIHRVEPGDVLVASMTSPDYVPAMRRAAAIVTNQGGQTSHAAIVSRELGVPAVVGTVTATKTLKPNLVITVNGSTGDIFKGSPQKSVLEQIREEPALTRPGGEPIRTATKIYVNLAEPSRAAEIGRSRVDGVGLLRAEFMLAEIGTHPRQLIANKKQSLFVNQLAQGLETFCRAFDPRPVVYRTTDFKTNEYRHLKGGDKYEPEEPNPMLGFRGAYRYIVDSDVFELELEAVKQVRHKSGFKNLWLMIPYVHTPKELLEVKKIVTASGLHRSPTFELWMMVEIPSNVILLDEFIEVGIDGVSIGSNDLSMLILGVDRDNQQVAKALDPLDPAVMWATEKTIKTCHQHHITVSICGQAPSIYPKLTQKLVEWGITSISVNPDAIDQTRRLVHLEEEKLLQK